MKKKLLAILVAVCAAFALFSFAACTDNENSGTGVSGDVATLENGIAFTVKSDVMSIADTTTIKDYMDVLMQNGDLSYGGSAQGWGYLVETINGVTANSANNEYWAFYTDLFTLDDVDYASDEYSHYDYDGKTLGYANYGVDGMPCVVGYTYLFVLESY